MSLQPETVECLSFDPLFVVLYYTDNMSWGPFPGSGLD